MTDDRSDLITVLLIEDSRADTMLVKAHLAPLHSPAFQVHHEENLQAGIERLREMSTDVVILDLTLPDSCGLETFLAVREHALDVPIIILSGVEDSRIALEAVRQGAQDFLNKNEAISESLGRLLQYTIERFRRQQFQREIDTAALIQKRLYPHPLPPLKRLDVAGRCDPANKVGGDYFDYFLTDASHLMLVIGDVSGHGFGPSLVMAQARAALRTLAATTNDVGLILQQTNQLLYEDELGTFVSLFLASVDIVTGACSYASAGHPSQLLRADGSTELLDSRQPPLGVQPKAQFDVQAKQLSVGDTLLLYTDGIPERACSSQELFGVARMLHVLGDCHELTAEQTIARLFDATRTFGHSTPAADDMTAIVVRVTEPVGASPDAGLAPRSELRVSGATQQ